MNGDVWISARAQLTPELAETSQVSEAQPTASPADNAAQLKLVHMSSAAVQGCS